MSEAAAGERVYALTRLGPGDYLLPSNDAKTLWRIVAYEEHGSLVEYPADDPYGSRGPGRKIVGRFWAAYYWRDGLPTEDDLADPEEFLNFWSGRWVEWVSLCRTRAEAIADALRGRE